MEFMLIVFLIPLICAFVLISLFVLTISYFDPDMTPKILAYKFYKYGIYKKSHLPYKDKEFQILIEVLEKQLATNKYFKQEKNNLYFCNDLVRISFSDNHINYCVIYGKTFYFEYSQTSVIYSLLKKYIQPTYVVSEEFQKIQNQFL